MSTSAVTQPGKQEQGGSFFKLIDSFAWEIGTLKKDMGKKCESPEGDPHTNTLAGLGEELRDLFLQASPRAGVRAGPAAARDSGYNSLRRRLTVLERLVRTHTVWLQLGLSHKDATRILRDQPPGTFLVRKSSSLERKVISVRMEKGSAAPIKDFPVKESQYTFSLEGSGLSFADLFRLVAFCCISRDVLPFPLRLPEAIASATPLDLEEFAKLGAGLWDAHLCRRGSASLSGTAAVHTSPPHPTAAELPTRSPSELECYQSNGALCFINPLFIKVHRPNGVHSTAAGPPDTVKQDLREGVVVNNQDSDTKVTQSCYSLHFISSDQSVCSRLNVSNLQSLGTNVEPQDKSGPANYRQKLLTTNHVCQCPPPPSVPRGSMPQKISWIIPKEKMEEREKRSSLHFLSGLRISPSSSPKSLSVSSPVAIPQPPLPPSLSSLSSSPHQDRVSLSSSQEDPEGHQVLEDWYIEKVIAAKGSQGSTVTTEDSSGGQRLSDTSLSTDSSDCMDSSQSSVFFLPRLHDPSSPTVADFNAHLPLSIPPSHLPYCSVDQDDEDDEEPDCSVSFESDLDQDQDVTMMPPSGQAKCRPGAGAVVLQRALRGHLHKMSGVFSSLLTPEKRVIRKVLELSRDKGSYFGCLVQDYLSYMGESAAQAWQGYASGPELLQTVRQFLTQMKSYLRQTSEVEPPLESLIPKDHIDGVLEKAMHKCVLKSLRAALGQALQQFQVRSGAWQELTDNLALAKARQPQEMGVANALPPDPVAIEKIRQKFHRMCKLYSPEKKVAMLLSVCKLVYAVMEDNSGRLYGADDFLPMLTYVLAQCDMPQLDNEILYMMELLDPSLLNGEGGYYLTSAYGAMTLIRNFQEEQAASVLSSETRDTLRQWHRRRTAPRSDPSFDDFQNFLRVALQEPDSGCTAKTLQVRPHATAEDVCQLCAHKFKVSDPENYGLFLVMEGRSQQLAPDSHPQRIKAELHSRSQSAPFHFVFRPMANSNNVSPAPCATTAKLSIFAATSDPQANLSDLSGDVSGPSTRASLSPAL